MNKNTSAYVAGILLRKDDPSPRQHLYRSLCEELIPLTHEKRKKKLDDLLEWAGQRPMVRPTHRVMSPDELRSLAGDGLVEVGAHTVGHCVLSMLSVDEQRTEIRESKAHLENILNQEVRSFSYPYGTRAAYKKETVNLVKEAGFLCACSNFHGVVLRDADRFQLPRALVRDWNGDEFQRRLSRWFQG